MEPTPIDISLFEVLWTAGVVFAASMVSQSLTGSIKELKERVNIALACTVGFTPLALGLVFIYGS